ncbi:DUF1992 domain-containing protein [Actinokineospora sp. NBRC 105648]|uniref:DnaJ family domain-containing protein n=1 Tax=Actinokineospora sp. NBRC 105648 TaxID=3032206 RepID=UPI0024A1677C|nr:DUF1992 domain-containing protein [Actinokineospora sp. NBRC 105648]GLZ39763.1 DUF1992 domain-containing protein [Actinokineospora sp. NBRC 105648]
MTKRKPRGVSVESWVESQIRAAADRGEFDNLPGTGKPLTNLHPDNETWLADYLRKEGLSAEALLPEALRLRKEAERLPEAVRTAPTEQQVRDTVADLNTRIEKWMRSGTDTHFQVRFVDEQSIVDHWHTTRVRPSPPPTPEPGPEVKPRWWRRRTSR